MWGYKGGSETAFLGFIWGVICLVAINEAIIHYCILLYFSSYQTNRVAVGLLAPSPNSGRALFFGFKKIFFRGSICNLMLGVIQLLLLSSLSSGVSRRCFSFQVSWKLDALLPRLVIRLEGPKHKSMVRLERVSPVIGFVWGVSV